MNFAYRLLFFLFFILSTFLHAQDTVVFYNGNEVICRIVSSNHYKLIYNVNGDTIPITAEKEDIFMIKHSNGKKEIVINTIREERKPTAHSFMLDYHFGFPVWATLNTMKYDLPAKKEITKNLFFWSLRGEYLFNENFGAQLEYMKTSFNIYFTDTIANTDKSGHFKRDRFLVKFNFYNHTSFKKWSSYGTLGIGYKNQTLTVEGQKMQQYSILGNIIMEMLGVRNPQASPLFPHFAYRAGFGLRYFFEKHVGFNIEFGLGGPLIQTGLTVKL